MSDEDSGAGVLSSDSDEAASEEEGVENDAVPDEPENTPQDELEPERRAVPLSRRVIIVRPEERVTSHVLQRAEAARLISIRAKQISDYPTSYVADYVAEAGKGACPLHDPKDIAKRELFQRRIPLLLRRQVGQTPGGDLIVEEWNPREMTLPPL